MITHTHAAILSTGDEIILGQLQDSNARWIAEQLVDAGVKPVEIAGVGDDAGVLAATILRLAALAPLVVMSGGLGPTDGDLTRDAVAAVLGCGQVLDSAALADLDAKLAARGRTMTDRLKRQAFRPAHAACLFNAFGTAPGLHAVVPAAGPHGHTDLFCLPGPPGELQPMFRASVRGALRLDPARLVRTRLVQVVGLAESDAVQRLGDLTRRDRSPLVGVTASGGQLTIRIRAERGEGSAAGSFDDAALEGVVERVRAALAPHVFATGDETLPAAVLAALRRAGAAGGPSTLVVAESCTGGLLGNLLSDTPGASDVFLGGWITYANALKASELGVPEELIASHGAVSEPVARAMTLGALRRSGADHALAITGIAGPNGGTEAKPVGTVFIALASRAGQGGATTPNATADRIDVRRLQIPGGRDDVRSRAARAALALAWFHLAGVPLGDPALIWERRPQ